MCNESCQSATVCIPDAVETLFESGKETASEAGRRSGLYNQPAIAQDFPGYCRCQFVTDAAKKTTVLLIEDEAQIRRLLRVCLERNGYDVVEAVTGEEAIDEAIRCQPQAVLLDLGLPDMDGMTVLKRLREYPGVAGLKPSLAPQSPVLPIAFWRDNQRFSYFSLVTTVGTPQCITAQELRVECMFPTDVEGR